MLFFFFFFLSIFLSFVFCFDCVVVFVCLSHLLVEDILIECFENASVLFECFENA